jgi:hypothetical protein
MDALGDAVLHGIFRSAVGEAYHQKRSAFESLLKDAGQTLPGFVKKVFGKQRFKDTSTRKRDLVLELLRDQLSAQSWRLIRDRLRTQPYLTDRRHTEEYAFDIALGWLEEELIIEQLEARLPKGTSIKRVGIDSMREFLSLNIRATADLEIRSSRRVLLVDIFVDHTGSWKKNGFMDLKAGKLKHFKEGRLDLVLGLDLQARRFHLVTGAEAAGIPMRPNAAMGGTATAPVPVRHGVTLSRVSALVASALRKSQR